MIGGGEALSKRGILTLKYPVEHGIVTNWDDAEKLMHHMFYTELRCDPCEHPVLMSESPHNPKANREKLTQICFETFNTPAFYLIADTTLTAYCTGRTTALVVSSGDGVTWVAPVYEGHTLQHASLRSDVAGRDVTDELRKLLTERGYAFTTTAEREIVSGLKCEFGFVSQDLERDLAMCTKKPKLYEKWAEMYDGQIISFDKERFLCTEPLVREVSERLEWCLARVDPDLHEVLLKNVVLGGGSTQFPGFARRVKLELEKHFPKYRNIIKVIAPTERMYVSWIGGSILASISTFQRIWISKEEYDENGPAIVHRKCF